MKGGNIQIKLISARNIHVDLTPKSKVYAVVWIEDGSRPAKQKAMAKEHGTNPTWNKHMSFTVDEEALQQGRLHLKVEIRVKGLISGKKVGDVSIPMKEFLGKRTSGGADFRSYQLGKSSGKTRGMLDLSVKINKTNAPQYLVKGSTAPERKERNNEVVTTYPPYTPPTADPLPPPLLNAGYPHTAPKPYPHQGPPYNQSGHPPYNQSGYPLYNLAHNQDDYPPRYNPPYNQGSYFPYNPPYNQSDYPSHNPGYNYPPYNQGGYLPYNPYNYPPYNQGNLSTQQSLQGLNNWLELLHNGLNIVNDVVNLNFGGGDFGGGDFGGGNLGLP